MSLAHPGSADAHVEQGAAVDYHFWATGVPESQRSLPPPKRLSVPKAWRAEPGAWFNRYQIHGSTIEHSLRAQENWKFADLGKGTVTFTARNAGGGLVISLLSWNLDDSAGYHVVLDDDNRESYVLRLTGLGNNGLLKARMDGGGVSRRRKYARVPGVWADPAFRLNSVEQKLWVMYQRGSIVVGVGHVPGAGQIVLHMQAPPDHESQHLRGRELYHFGFARLGNRWNMPTTVFDVTSYKYLLANDLPLPARPADDVQPNAAAKKRTVPSGGVLYEPKPFEDAPLSAPSNIPWTPSRMIMRDSGVPTTYGHRGGVGGSQ